MVCTSRITGVGPPHRLNNRRPVIIHWYTYFIRIDLFESSETTGLKSYPKLVNGDDTECKSEVGKDLQPDCKNERSVKTSVLTFEHRVSKVVSCENLNYHRFRGFVSVRVVLPIRSPDL